MQRTDEFIEALHHLKCAETALIRLSVIDDDMATKAGQVKEIADSTLKTWKELFEGNEI